MTPEVNTTYGRLTVIASPTSRRMGSRLRKVVLCECVCGVRREVLVEHLQSGHSKSCGCWAREPHSLTHGMSKHPVYAVWSMMIQRCHNSRNKNYRQYGGRGIRVCDAWRNSFSSFIADMGTPPNKSMQIDRIDTNRNYEPGNCRWTTSLRNNRNRRNNRRLTHNGRTLCISEWAEIMGVKETLIRNRLDILGWSVTRAIITPPGKTGIRHAQACHEGTLSTARPQSV